MALSEFPSLTTYVGDRIDGDQAASAELERYLLDVYAGPLKGYIARTSWAETFDPDEVVHEFILNVIERGGYLTKWRGTGTRLRRYLANGLLMFCKHYHRESNGRRTVSIEDGLDDVSSAASIGESDPREIDFDQAVLRSLVNRALGDARRECEGAGLLEHFDLFERYYARSVPFCSLLQSCGLAAEKARTRLRTAKERFVACLKRVIESEIDSSDSQTVVRELQLMIGNRTTRRARDRDVLSERSDSVGVTDEMAITLAHVFHGERPINALVLMLESNGGDRWLQGCLRQPLLSCLLDAHGVPKHPNREDVVRVKDEGKRLTEVAHDSDQRCFGVLVYFISLALARRYGYQGISSQPDALIDQSLRELELALPESMHAVFMTA